MMEMPQNRHRKPVSVTFDPEFLIELDEWLEAQPYKIARAQFIERAARQQLSNEKKEAQDEKRKK